MIESISIEGMATYADRQVMLGLSKFNFIFGTNGTGKTSISRVIADVARFPMCEIKWTGGTQLEPMVYNRDFVEKNFTTSQEIKGIFTLGEKQADTLTKIALAKEEVGDLTAKIVNLTQVMQGLDGNGGKKGELAAIEEAFKTKCWLQKQKHDAKLQGAFEGYRGSADKFKTKLLEESLGQSGTESVLSLAELTKKAESIFGPRPTIEKQIPLIDATALLAHEIAPILAKRVIGKEDVDIAAIIKKLGNSDWVREGQMFYDSDTRICPFCQQKTDAAFGKSLAEYFDETFIADSNAIEQLSTSYTKNEALLQQQLASIIALQNKFLDIEKLKAAAELLASEVTINNQRLISKKKELSQVVELVSLNSTVNVINSLITAANEKIITHNKMVEEIATEKFTLTKQVWRFVLAELRLDLEDYKGKRTSLEKAISSMQGQIETAITAKKNKTTEIRALERQTTSVQPTIDGINALLASFGFQGFKLAIAEMGTAYKLVRENGTDAKNTLSEGEKTFVTFLYFYYLLKGSISDSGMTTDRIVVFDDPVSSLDSDILFIVGSLIRQLFVEVREQKGHIKQIFILTHNVYFHKEIAYNQKRSGNKAMHKEESFWIVRKLGLCSKVEKHDSNPIKTSYELLWAEVRRADRSNLTIQNTLRRIIENYFKILGGIDNEAICNYFTGRDKVICQSLISWVNDGSHFAHDDLYVTIDDAIVENYLKVFKEIFDKSDHSAHYKMMMVGASAEVENI